MNSLKAFIAVAALGLFAGSLRAEDAPAKPWKNTGELSVVSTNGNSKATTTSAKNTFNYDWSKAGLELVAGGLGSQSRGETTAEQYNASEKVSVPLTADKKNYVFEKFGWDSNRFAGYRNRYDASAGYGREVFKISSSTLISELGAGYVNEERINSPRNDFALGRAYAKYTQIISATAHFTQDAEYLHSFDDSKDYRLNMESAIVASISTHLALKASFKWNRVAKPPVGFGKDDTTTSVALVVNY